MAVVCVARLVEAKALDTLLPCVRLRSACLLLRSSWVTVLSEDGRLESLATELGLRVVFTGSIPWERIIEVYVASDLFALVSRHEPWGVVVNEAAAGAVSRLFFRSTSAPPATSCGPGKTVCSYLRMTLPQRRTRCASLRVTEAAGFSSGAVPGRSSAGGISEQRARIRATAERSRTVARLSLRAARNEYRRAMMGTVTQALRAQRPLIHEDGRTCAGLSWEALEWLEFNVRPGMRTLETGAGLSTIVFAASGATHIVVTPEAAEEAPVREACRSLGVGVDGLRFVIGPSEEMLPELPERELDVVLIDGAHGFPYAILDWWHLGRRLRLGGGMLLDDAYLPPVLAILDGLRGVPAWRVEGPISNRTVLVRKLTDRASASSVARRAIWGPRELSLPPALTPTRRVDAGAGFVDATRQAGDSGSSQRPRPVVMRIGATTD